MKKELIKDVMDWHAETFPEATGSGQLSKLNEEVNEYVAIRADDFGVGLEELADIFIVGCGLARFSNPGALMAFGFVYTECIDYCKNFGNDVVFYLDLVSEAVVKKMETNRQRKWTKGKGEYKHVGE